MADAEFLHRPHIEQDRLRAGLGLQPPGELCCGKLRDLRKTASDELLHFVERYFVPESVTAKSANQQRSAKQRSGEKSHGENSMVILSAGWFLASSHIVVRIYKAEAQLAGDYLSPVRCPQRVNLHRTASISH